MKEVQKDFGQENEEETFALKGIVLRYLRYWPWFLATILFCLFCGYIYMRYATINYMSVAKIKIIDESKRTKIASEEISNIWGISTINLDNEIAVLKSYRLLGEVVTDLNLDVSYFYEGFFKSTEIWDAPFIVSKFNTYDGTPNPRNYFVKILTSGFSVIDENDKEYVVPFNSENHSALGLPFSIELKESIELDEYEGVTHRITLKNKKKAITSLARRLKVQPTNKKSDILALSLEGESISQSEAILNNIIDKFNKDAIEDMQMVSKRTLDFIDERFIYLTSELDSIELGKQDFKRDNSLAYIEEDATTILKRKSDTEEQVFDLENQLSLTRLLRSAVVNAVDYGLLPPEIGLDNTSINSLVSSYNEIARERMKLLSSVQENHPSIQTLNSQLRSAKENVLKTVDVYQRQLNSSLTKLNQERELADEMFSRLPEKEKMLRAIERQQSIKENLFLLLLQKREEAAINNAVTAPVIKVVDYAQTDTKPISPKKVIIYPLCLLLGGTIPFLVLFLRFSMDMRIQDRKTIEKLVPEISILSEIPYLENQRIFRNRNDRSALAESFRVLSTNVDFHLQQKKNHNESKVIYVASAIKGEGKTLIALNLSLALASLNKKVLLVGGDLRNPQLHTYFNLNRNGFGLSDYLHAPEINWEECISSGFVNIKNHQICFSGTVPNNPPELLSGKNFELFLDKTKKEFDYIIVDTAPALLVADTLLISKYADLTLFVVRLGFTDKRLLEFSKDLVKNKKLEDTVYLLNDVGHGQVEGSNYGYGYGYGYTTEENTLEKILAKIKVLVNKVPVKNYVNKILNRFDLKI